jgi:hypothetical protein
MCTSTGGLPHAACCMMCAFTGGLLHACVSERCVSTDCAHYVYCIPCVVHVCSYTVCMPPPRAPHARRRRLGRTWRKHVVGETLGRRGRLWGDFRGDFGRLWEIFLGQTLGGTLGATLGATLGWALRVIFVFAVRSEKKKRELKESLGFRRFRPERVQREFGFSRL